MALSDEEIAATKAVCANGKINYCQFIGQHEGCRVGRGQSPTVENCKMRLNAMPLTREFSTAMAVLATLKEKR